MRNLTLLCCLALAGCGGRTTRPAQDFCRQGRDVLRSQQYPTLLAQVESTLQHTAQSSPCYWQLRLLRVEILLEQRERDQAGQALQFDLPAGPSWTELRARYELSQSNLARGKGDLTGALRHLDEAQNLAGAIGASGLLAEIELRRASVAMYMGNLAEAQTKLRHVADDAVRRHDPYLQMKAQGIIGYLLSEKQFRYEDAIPVDEEYLKLAQSLGAIDDQARAKLNLGWTYYHLLDRDKAQHYLEEAARGFEQTGNRRDNQLCVGDMAGILLDRHQYQPAADMYRRALGLAVTLHDREHQASWLNNLAEIAIETGDWNSAERYNSQAWDLWKNDGHWEYYSMVKAGKIATGRTDFTRADQLYRAVLQQKSSDPEPLLRALSGRAYMLAKEGRNRDAEAEYHATDAAMEQQRTKLSKEENKLDYFSGQIDFYQEYVAFLMKQNRSRDALETAEASRARALLDRMRVAHARRVAGTTAAFQKVAAAAGGVLLSYWVAPDASYLWAVTKSDVRVSTLPGESHIREMVRAYDDYIQAARDPLGSGNSAGRQLYETLIAPAAALLPRNSKVVIVPDGPLYGLNFETLPVPGTPPHYWIEDVRVSVTPSLDLLAPGRNARSQAAQSLLLIGNPVSPVAQYPDLEFAAQEMDGIRKDLPAFRQVVRAREQAEPAVYSRSGPAQFGYIHFVAHAVANSEEPLESAVILSRAGADYKLRARDVLGTPLQANLVTISACRSAGARIYAGEGLVGFPWAFLEAGAQNVIAGLWDVSDRSTADLMSRLYAGIARGADPATALRDAKLGLIRAGGAWQKPYYWGPFELFTRQAQ